MILIKNPAGCNQVLNFLTQRTEPFVFAACLNDRAQDGKDVSWIWDVDFERLTAMEGVLSDIYRIRRARGRYGAALFVCRASRRSASMSRRITVSSWRHWPRAGKLPVFVMPTYTAMLALRGTIAKRLRLQGILAVRRGE